MASSKNMWGKPLAERFWAKVDKGPHPNGCWPWTGGTTHRGYGVIYDAGKNRRASQVSWEIHNGKPFPAGMKACHSCDNPPCVNPEHIWPGTLSDNLNDAIAKGRFTPPNRYRDVTHCPHGHPYTGDNLIVRKGGGRRCRTCQRATQLKTYYKLPHRRERDQSKAAKAARGAARLTKEQPDG